MSVEINVTDQIIEVTPTAGQIDVNITENPVVVDATDQIIEIADTGLQGPQGPAGPGVPTGGTTGQILAKIDGTNFNTEWIDNYTTDVREKIKAGEAINKGQAVYISGADGTNIIVSKASNATESTSSKTIGLLAQTLANNGQGFVITEGKLSGLNTSAATIGDPVWLGVNGNLLYGVANKPIAPANLVYLGVVTRVNANNGEIFIHVINGFELDELHNVRITNPTNNQVLKYNSTTQLWENGPTGNGTVTSVNASGGTGISVSGGPITTSGILTIINTAPDQIVSLSGAGTTSITGTYPNFTITSNDQYDGTVTSVDASGGTGISVSGGPITSSGSFTITNTAPDQVVSLTGTGTTSISGTYPNFTINSDDQYDGTVTSVDLTAGTGISVSGGPITSSGSITVTNTAPDQVVSITGSGTTSVSGTYPNFTISSADQYVGTVTSVDASVPTGFSISGNPITSSGTLAIGFASGYSLPTNAKQTEWDSAYTNRITTLTTTGSSGSATLISNTLNIPTYTLSGLGGVPSTRTLTVNGTGYDLSADRSWSVGTITSLTGEATASGSGAVSVTLDNASVIGKVLTGLNLTGGGSIVSTDSILQAFGKVQNQISALVGSVQYEGVWNASTNSPTIASGVGSKGDYYVVNVAGSTTIDGISDWKIGDWIIFNGTTWDKVDNTDAVSSVNGFTGAVSLSTSNIGEGTNLYFTNTRAQNAITLTTSGTSGSATYSGGTLNIPTYSLSGLGGVPTTRTLTINGTAYDLSADRSWSVGTVTSVAALTIGTTGTDVSSSVANGTTTPVITLNIPTASATNRGALSSADWSTFNSKEPAIAAGTTSQYWRGDKSWQTLNTAAVTESTNLYYTDARARAALSFVAGSGAYNSTTGVITIPTNTNQLTNGANYITLASLSASAPLSYNPSTGAFTISQASTSTNGFLSSTDWNTFNNKQNALTNPVTGTGTTNYLPKFTGASTIGNSQIFDNGSSVGIGTTSASSYDTSGNNLVVYENGNAGITIATPSTGYGNIFFADGTGSAAAYAGYIEYNHNNNALAFGTNSTEKARIDVNGNLGLGVTPSAFASAQRAFQILNGSIYADAGSTGFQYNAYYNGTSELYIANGFATSYYQYNGQHIWRTAPSGTAGNAITFTQAMTLNSDGRLLLGYTTNQTTDRLQINGNARAAGYVYSTDGTREIYLNPAADFGNGALPSIQVATNHALQFATNNTLRLTIASTGAATFSSSVSATQLLTNYTYSAGSQNYNIRLKNDLSSDNGYIAQLGGETSIANNAYYASAGQYTATATSSSSVFLSGGNIIFNAQSGLTNGSNFTLTERMRITSAGLIGINTNSPFNFGTGSAMIDVRSQNTTAISGVFMSNSNASARLVNYINSAAQGFIGTASAHDLDIGTSDVYRIRIKSGGNVLVGTTTDTGEKFQVNGTVKATTLVKSGGTSAQLLAANGDSITAGANITISGGVISTGSGGVVTSEKFLASNATYTLTSTTASQRLFNVGAISGNPGAISVNASKTYFFEALVRIVSMSSTSGNGRFDLKGAGTAGILSTGYTIIGIDTSATTDSFTTSGVYSDSPISNPLVGSAGTGLWFQVKGIFRTTSTGGTIIPSFILNTAAAAIVSADSFFKLYEVGSNTANYEGQ